MRYIKRLAVVAVSLTALLVIAGIATADSYTNGNFEPNAFSTSWTGAGGTEPVGTVNGQDGWHSSAPGQATGLSSGDTYDQQVVDNSAFGTQDGGLGFGDQSLRMSNARTSGEFTYQTYSPSVSNPAGEGLGNQVFDGTFQFTSTSPNLQDGLHISVSPDNGSGARMSYVRLDDTPGGIQATFVDYGSDNVERDFVSPTLYSRTGVHTVEFKIQTVNGPANDVVRLLIDNVDIGNQLHACFTTWESYYRDPVNGEGHEPGVINSFEFRSAGDAAFNTLGGGYLFDNVSTDARSTGGPAPTNCSKVGTFCSPGFWKNSDAAWATLAPTITKNSLFNSVVVPNFYATIVPSTTTLWDVLSKPATKYGKAAGPLGLTPFNAVGAALSSALPGYVYDPNATTCALNNHGIPIAPPA